MIFPFPFPRTRPRNYIFCSQISRRNFQKFVLRKPGTIRKTRNYSEETGTFLLFIRLSLTHTHTRTHTSYRSFDSSNFLSFFLFFLSFFLSFFLFFLSFFLSVLLVVCPSLWVAWIQTTKYWRDFSLIDLDLNRFSTFYTTIAIFNILGNS